MSNWKGTPVPNTGYVENVYFNTNLSVEEVVSLVNQLETEGFLLISSDMSIMFAYMYDNIIENDDTRYLCIASSTGIIFNELDGWSSDITYPIPVNMEVISSVNMGNGDISIGTQNDKLSTLFSITPFEQGKDKWVRVKKSTITGIGDAIREKEGSSDLIPTSQMKRRILDIKSGTDTSDATATSEDILLGKTAYVNDVKVVGAIEEYDGSVENSTENAIIKANIERTMEQYYRKKISGFQGKSFEYEQYLYFELKTQEIYKKILGGN